MIFVFDDFRLDTRILELRRDDVPLHVEPKVFDLLRLLIENRDRVVGRDEILDRVWDGRIVSDSTLGGSINAVRRAVGDDGKRQEIIRTLPRRGFRFVAPVVVLDDAGDVPSQPRLDRPAIAVLPYRNISGDPDQDEFVDGLTEDVITDLAKFSGLFVIARNSVFTYRERPVSPEAASRELGVRYVVDGSVRRTGNQIRVSTRLVDGTTGGLVWAERFDRELNDIFAVQDELTAVIVSKLALKLTDDERGRLGRRGTENLEAYDCFVRGRARTWLFTKTARAEAYELLLQAIANDPEFAPPYAFLAFNHVLDFISGWSKAIEISLEKGIQAAMKAVELDPIEPFARWSLGLASLYAGNQERAIEEAKRCLALEPSSPEGHYLLSHSLIYAGRFEEAIETLEILFRLDPRFPDFTLYFMAEAHYHLGRYDKAIAFLRERLDRESESDASHVLLAACLGQVGKRAEARTQWDAAHRISPEYSIEHKRRVLPFADPAHFDHVVNGLRKAGVTAI